MQYELWETDNSQTNEYVLHLRDPKDWYEVRVKWDGCVDFYQAYNTPLPEKITTLDTSDISYIHICHLEYHIKRLQDVHKRAIEHFGKNWE